MTPLLINSMPGTESPWVYVRDRREILFHGSGKFGIIQKTRVDGNGSYSNVSSNVYVDDGHRHALLIKTERVKIIFLEGDEPVSVDIV